MHNSKKILTPFPTKKMNRTSEYMGNHSSTDQMNSCRSYPQNCGFTTFDTQGKFSNAVYDGTPFEDTMKFVNKYSKQATAMSAGMARNGYPTPSYVPMSMATARLPSYYQLCSDQT